MKLIIEIGKDADGYTANLFSPDMVPLMGCDYLSKANTEKMAVQLVIQAFEVLG